LPVDALSGWTFERHLLEFSERVGLADQSGSVATLPANAHDHDKVKRYWNAGYKHFISADPNWSFCKESVSLTLDPTGLGPSNIDQNPALYRLPSYCQGPPRGNWRYVDANAPYDQCVVYQDRLVDQMREAGGASTGAPRFAGHGAHSAKDGPHGDKIAWRVQFFPIPDIAYVLQADFRIRNHALQDLGEGTVAGSEHDLTILACALMEWSKVDDDMADRRIMFAQDAAGLLIQSRELDKHNRPRNLGQLKTTGTQNTATRRLSVTHYNGTPIPGVS